MKQYLMSISKEMLQTHMTMWTIVRLQIKLLKKKNVL